MNKINYFYKLFLNQATGIRIGGVLMNIGNFGIGLILAFVYGWAITLVIIAFVPLMIVSGVLQTKLITGFAGKDKEILEEAGKVKKKHTIQLIILYLLKNI